MIWCKRFTASLWISNGEWFYWLIIDQSEAFKYFSLTNDSCSLGSLAWIVWFLILTKYWDRIFLQTPTPRVPGTHLNNPTPSHTNTDKINKAETPGLKTWIWCFDALHANKSQQERNSQTIRHYASEQWDWDNKIRRDWVELKSRHPGDNDGLTCDIPPLLSGSWAGHMTRPPCSYAPPAPSTAEHCNTPQTPAILTE